jgi:uncharacterized protein (TIGR00661 family)
MLKILYAAGNTINSKIQLDRFLQAINGHNYIIKVAAYKQSSPKINIDWTLNCLHNYYDSRKTYLDSEYFMIYYNQVKDFNPDLIISDLEYFTSYIANDLNITLWQCSSSMLNYGLSWNEKYNSHIFSNYSYLINRRSNQKYINIIDNSNLNLVYSHFGDTQNSPQLKENFEWIRPYHYLGQKSIPCQHNIVAAAFHNKKIISSLSKLNDCVMFSSFDKEKYSNLIIKDIENTAEYACNVKNCNLFICEGQTSFLSDAFYNNKFTIVMPNLKDTECIINSMYSEKIKLSKNIYSNLDIDQVDVLPVNYVLNDKIDYLHERLEKI